MSCACTETIDTPGPVARWDKFIIPADTDWEIVLTWLASDGTTLINLTGYTARAVLSAPEQASLALTTENGGITLGGTAGTILLTLTAAQTAAMATTSYTLGLDLITGAGKKSRFLEGLATVTKDTTPAL